MSRVAEDRFVLAVDLGTSGAKVGLVTTRGEVAWWGHQPLTTTYADGGKVTQDPEEWWEVVTETTRRGLGATGVGPASVVAVGVTGQWSSTVPVDADGKALTDCLMWTDTRGGRHSRDVVGGRIQGYRARPLATWIRRSGGVPSTSGADPVGHMLHVEHDRPELARRVRWYLEPVDHLTTRLTGTPTASAMSMTAAWLTDNRRPDAGSYDDVLVRLAGVPGAKLPPLRPAGSVVGTVHPGVAAELGITPSARVVTGMPDLHAAAVGSGAIGLRESHVSIGTSGWVTCPLDKKKTDVLRQCATVPGIGPHPYLLGNNQESSGRCLQWFREYVAGGTGSMPTYEELLGLAATSPPGANGVLFTPWLTGERSPVDDRRARAGFHNIGVTTTYADLARAVLEGVAHNTRWLLEACDHVVGSRLDPLRLVGGGARSDLWCQVMADVCGRTLHRVRDPLLTGLRGVALTAGVALGDIGWSDVAGLVPVDRAFSPDPAVRAVYDPVHAAFTALHRGQRRLFRLNRV